MGNEVPKGSDAAKIIGEEERLYGQVQARVAMGEEEDERPMLGASDLDSDLLSLRDQISEARAEDLPTATKRATTTRKRSRAAASRASSRRVATSRSRAATCAGSARRTARI